jgi:hypothetical protein
MKHPETQSPETESSSFISFVCPGCGKSTRAKAEWAGKNARCPHCGHAVVVPSASTAPAALPIAAATTIRRFPRWVPVLVLLAGLAISLAVWHWSPRADESKRVATEMVYDFRSQLLPADLQVIGDPQGDLVKPEAEGLRVTIPKPRIHPWGGVGVRSVATMHGDFEVTATYEILQAETPPTGYGVGVALRLRKKEPSAEIATLCRMVRADGVPIVLWDKTTVAADGKPHIEQGRAHCPAATGRLRVKRTGSVWHYLHAPGATAGEFEEIHQCDFGDGDLALAEFTGITGRQPCDLDVRLLGFRISAESAVLEAGGAPWLAPAAISAVAFLLAGTLFGMGRLRRSP